MNFVAVNGLFGAKMAGLPGLRNVAAVEELEADVLEALRVQVSIRQTAVDDSGGGRRQNNFYEKLLMLILPKIRAVGDCK